MRGSGTQQDPYIIENVDDLQAMENDLAAYYELGGDIDASATSGWNNGAGFLPIAQAGSFTGSFDGKGFIITNLFINRGAPTNVGLFLLNNGVIKNVGLIDCNIAGFGAGSIAQLNYTAGRISKCYATGAVDGINNAGGFVNLNYGSIQNCYSRCSVNAGSYAGGFVDYNYAGGTTDNCYSTGAVTSGWVAGGYCQYNAGSITDCFWDTETSGQATSDGGTGKTTAQMKTKSTFTDAGWDFTTIWGIFGYCNDGYPCLRDVTPNCEVRWKGNPNIDQLIYQHVERMDR